MDLHKQFEQFIQSKIAAQRSRYTTRTYRYHVDRFLGWCVENAYSDNDMVGTVGAEMIEEYLLSLSIDHSPHTVDGAYRAVRALYRFIERREGPIEQGNPFKWLERPSTPDLLPKAISYNDFILLSHSIKTGRWVADRDRLIIKLLFYTGMRQRELVELCIEDIDLERRRIRLYRSKTKTEAFIPISLSLRNDMATWLTAQRPECSHTSLWPTLIAGEIAAVPLAADGLISMLRRRCRNAGLASYGTHAFRHGCAVHIIQHGGDLSLVKDLLGHRDIATTQVYLRFDVERLTSLYDRIFE